MAFGLSNRGEEYIINKAFASENTTSSTTVELHLYNDSTDALTDSDGEAAVTTEPAGAAYAPQSVTETTEITVQTDADGDQEAIFSDVSFDTSDSTQSVDGFYVTTTFDGESNTDTGPHLILRGPLGSTTDLSEVDKFTAKGAGLSLD